jgi:4-hydroxyphenylpyruvate dioxygenase-like putative hemolysin
MRAVNVTDDAGHAITMIQPDDVDRYREWRYETWGVNHIGFAVDDLEVTLAQLREEGVEGIEVVEVEGQPVAKFRDLNGTEIDVADARYLVWNMDHHLS